ncbi:MAG: hypothetical protein EAX96_08940 [Candidatus Lokiarchaeota archaeon]|nr:hypothetical protein [Candidatus Lokiarchaeota archaeon]
MKAAVFKDLKCLEYTENYPKPIIGPEDALVKVHYCGICGSDLTNFKNKLYQVPLIMGHELAGEVVELGQNLTGFKIGDKVLGINVKLDVMGQELRGLGIFSDGGFAEYVKVHKNFLFHAPSNISLKNCTLVESIAVAIRAIKLSEIGENQKIMIIGGGNIGLITLMTLISLKSPEYTIVVEPFEFLRKKAEEFGATQVFPPSKVRIKNFLKKMGAPSFIFDCAGNEKSFKLSMDLVKRGGSVILLGIFQGSVTFPLLYLISNEIRLQGILGHDREDILEAIEIIEQKKVDPSKISSKIVHIEKIQEAFEDLLKPEKRNFLKTIIKI